MIQDDGSIEAYCTTRNHPNVLVNIPQLIEHAFRVAEGNEPHGKGTNGTTETGESITPADIPETQVQTTTTSNPPTIQHSSHTNDAGGDSGQDV